MVLRSVTATGVFDAWLKDRSGRVWPVAFAHGAVNVFIDGSGLIVILTPVALAYTATESGLATFAAITPTAVLLLVRGRTWAPRELPLVDHWRPRERDPATATLDFPGWPLTRAEPALVPRSGISASVLSGGDDR
jgi:hypothetical protein